MTTNAPPLVPSKKACQRLDIDRSTLTRWVAQGLVAPAMRMPGPRGAFLFEESEIARLENVRKVAS